MNQNHSDSFPDPYPEPWSILRAPNGNVNAAVDSLGRTIVEAQDRDAGYPPNIGKYVEEMVERVNRSTWKTS